VGSRSIAARNASAAPRCSPRSIRKRPSDSQGTGASGAYVGATQATITGNTLTGNADYGVECSVTSLDACYGNDLSSNGIAEQNGCDEACSAL
jgi:hypothetical protein